MPYSTLSHVFVLFCFFVRFQTIFPDNAYGVDSGGDPTAIPSLTFEYFKGFHQRFYHPGNSRVYFYGDDPPLKVP